MLYIAVKVTQSTSTPNQHRKTMSDQQYQQYQQYHRSQKARKQPASRGLDDAACYAFEVFGKCSICGCSEGTIRTCVLLSPTNKSAEKIVCQDCLPKTFPPIPQRRYTTLDAVARKGCHTAVARPIS